MQHRLLLARLLWPLIRQDTLPQCCFHVGPTSATSAQRENNIGAITRVYWAISHVGIHGSQSALSAVSWYK